MHFFHSFWLIPVWIKYTMYAVSHSSSLFDPTSDPKNQYFPKTSKTCFFFENFSQIKISHDSGGVRRSALDMLLRHGWYFWFLTKKYFFIFLSKKSLMKKISRFFCERGPTWQCSQKKTKIFFSSDFFRRIFFWRNIFSSKIKSIIHDVKHIQSRASNSSWVARNLDLGEIHEKKPRF